MWEFPSRSTNHNHRSLSGQFLTNTITAFFPSRSRSLPRRTVIRKTYKARYKIFLLDAPVVLSLISVHFGSERPRSTITNTLPGYRGTRVTIASRGLHVHEHAHRKLLVRSFTFYPCQKPSQSNKLRSVSANFGTTVSRERRTRRATLIPNLLL